MPKYLTILISLVAIHSSTKAAPNQQKHSVISDHLEDLSAFDNPFELSEDSNTDQSKLIEREKRYFDNIFPAVEYFNQRDGQYSGYSGFAQAEYNRNVGATESKLDAFFRNPYSWLDLFSNRRTQTLFLPIFVQPIACGCSEQSTNLPPNKNKETIQPPTDAPPNAGEVNTPKPGLTNRFNTDSDEDDDGKRPISFKPVEPQRPLSQQPPAFEHGSVQAGIEPSTPESNIAPPSFPQPNSESDLSPLSKPESQSPASRPSICDGAIVACCFQKNIGNCFERQGCADTSAYGDPCAPPVVLRVLESFQSYYKDRGIVKNFY